jgi:hypothetical protein
MVMRLAAALGLIPVTELPDHTFGPLDELDA